MSEDSDVPPANGDSPSGGDEPGDEVTPAERLLLLQQVDTESDQLRNRLERLEERTVETARRAELVDWERRLAEYQRRTEDLDATIDVAERRGKELDALKVRLEAQLRTIIAPREAEALMHEISTVDAQRDTNETDELEALEEQSEIEELLVAHRADEQGRRQQFDEARTALTAAVTEIEAALAEIDHRRSDARAGVDPDVLATYDRLRQQHGVAIARLEGKMCSGCHLDLSAAEVESAREVASSGSGLAECPQCGRLLVP
jgi:uncharacterized protein